MKKARFGGEPISNDVCQDSSECNAALRDLQVSRLTRRCAISAAMAAILAPLVFGEVQHDA